MKMYIKKDNKTVRMAVAFIAVLLAFIVLMVPVSAKAEDEEPDLNFVSDSVVKVSNYYHDSRDGDILLGEGYGILVGNEEKISTVLVNSSVVYVSDEKKAELMATYDKKEEKELDFFIRVQITADISTAATVHVFADNLNIAVLDMEQSIYDRKPILFDLDDDVKVQDSVYTVSSDNQWKGTLINYIGVNGILKISHDIPVTPDNCGAPLVNRKGELIGMLCYSNDSAHSYALDRTEIANVLKLIGMDYAVADHNDYTVDTTALQNAISIVEKMDMDIYTPDSVLQAEQTLNSAHEIVADENRTQEQVDQILKDVIAIPDSLEVDNSLSSGEIVLIIATSVLSLAVIALTVILILSKVKKNDHQNRAESKTTRDYYTVNEARDKKKETIVSGKKEADYSQSTQKPYAQQSIPNFAQSSSPASAETECFNPDETTVLKSMDYGNSNSCDFALVGNNGERITIDKSELTVGKSSSNADYVISKPSVSRAHAKLIYRDNSLFLKDLKSTNGTFINGEKLDPDKEYLLQKGMEVKFAGEIYKVE
ncbi:MAG: FHA domain-containing protein [Lachnospiraceae bacterium]|nr:FHA domain-containing protein [Lachnospiraceae bacterium]